LRRPITPQTLLQLQREREGNDDPSISAADRTFWRNRQRLIEQAEESGVPYWRQVMTQVLTTLDNIQDVVATAAWMGGPLLRRMGKLGTYLHGEVKSTATALGTMERALGGPLPGGRAKHDYMNRRMADARKRTGFIGGLQKGLDWFGKNQGHLLEAAQASETITGYGLVLGAVMGALEETYWRTGKSAYYQAMAYANGAIAALLPIGAQSRATVQAVADEYTRAGLQVPPAPPIEWAQTLWSQMQHPDELRRAWRGAAHMASGGTIALSLGEGDAALLLLGGAGMSLATGPAVAAIAGVLNDREIANLLVPPPRVTNPATRAMLELFGAPIDPRGGVGGEWATPDITLEEHTNQTIARWLKSEKPWLPADPSSIRAQLIHQLTEANAPATAALLTGDASAYRDRATPEDQLLFRVIELHAMPPSWASRAQLEQWAQHMLDAQTADPEAWRAKSFRELTAEYWAHQVQPRALIGR
jgi:hypothetical protein